MKNAEASESDEQEFFSKRVLVFCGGFRAAAWWLALTIVLGSAGLLGLVCLGPIPFVPWGTINGVLILAWAVGVMVGVIFISIARLQVTISQRGISWRISWLGASLYRAHHSLIDHPRTQDVTYDSVGSDPDHRLVDGPKDLSQVRVLIPYVVTFWFDVYEQDLLEIAELIKVYQSATAD